MQLSPQLRAVLLVAQKAQQEFDLLVMEQVSHEQRLMLAPIVVGCRLQMVQKVFVGLEKRLVQLQRAIPGLPFERSDLQIAFNVLG